MLPCVNRLPHVQSGREVADELARPPPLHFNRPSVYILSLILIHLPRWAAPPAGSSPTHVSQSKVSIPNEPQYQRKDQDSCIAGVVRAGPCDTMGARFRVRALQPRYPPNLSLLQPTSRRDTSHQKSTGYAPPRTPGDTIQLSCGESCTVAERQFIFASNSTAI